MTKPLSVAHRIGLWLAANPAGGTQRDIINGCVADQSRQAVASALRTMVATRKAVASGGTRYRIYTAGPDALVDRRFKHQRDTPKPAAAPPALLQQIVSADIKLPPRKKDVSADIAAFLRAGGRIERLPDGASANPLTHCGHRAVNEATWRERESLFARAEPETPVKHHPEPLSGPDFLDNCADANAAQGLDVNAAEFRRRARQWREDQQRLTSLESLSDTRGSALDDLRERIAQVTGGQAQPAARPRTATR